MGGPFGRWLGTGAVACLAAAFASAFLPAAIAGRGAPASADERPGAAVRPSPAEPPLVLDAPDAAAGQDREAVKSEGISLPAAREPAGEVAGRVAAEPDAAGVLPGRVARERRATERPHPNSLGVSLDGTVHGLAPPDGRRPA